MNALTLNLNLNPGGTVPPKVHLSQYDSILPTIEITLYDGTTAYTIPSGALVYVAGTKADHTGFEYACSFSGSVVTVVVTEQMTAYAGVVPCELIIYVGDERKGTANFQLAVEPAALSDDTIISETDIPIIQQLPTILADVTEAGETAVNNINTAKTEALNEMEDLQEDAEAWAVGTRGGEAVPTTDETYQSNSKYYAEQARQTLTGAVSAVAFNNRVDRNWDGLGSLVAGGTDVTADFDDGTLSAAIAANDLSDYDLGMQIKKTITIDGTSYTAHLIFAHGNAFFGYSSGAMVNTPNIGCVVYVEGFKSTWNASNTDGAYASSNLRVSIQKVVEALKTALGTDHMVSHNVLLSTAVSGGKSSGWAWTIDSYGEALSAAQACGVNPSGSYFDMGEAYEKLALFDKVRPNQVFGSDWLWFRDVITASRALILSYLGQLAPSGVTDSSAVVSLIMLK